MKRLGSDPKPIHERARNLAAESVDAELEPNDAEWLAGHLEACPDCAAVAEEYRAIHLELSSLPVPEPPRDLWARTAAGFDLADAAASRRSPRSAGASPVSRRPLFATAVAVGVVVVVAATSLIVQSPILNPLPGSTGTAAIALGTATPGQSSGGPQAPLAVVNGTSYWIASVAGVYEIKGGTTPCAATDGSCTMTNGTGQTLGSISSDTTVSAAIAPDATRAAVWTDNKVVIMPLVSSPQTVAIDLLTPRPTLTPAPATPSPSPTAAPTSTPAPSATAAISIIATVPATMPSVSPSPIATASATVAPSATTPGVAQATAILSGYQVVGRDPEFSPDGTYVAFSARPVDHSTGPDVFIWQIGQDRAQAVTFRHGDLFAGWFGQKVLISEIAPVQTSGGAVASAPDGTNSVGSTSYVFDPSTGKALEIARSMLLPTVDPTGQFLVYWSGSVEFDPVSGLWQPGKGDLYFDAWSDLTLTPASLATLPAPTPTPSPVATATPGTTTAPTLSPSPVPATTDEASPSLEPSAVASATTAAPTPAPSASAVQALPQLLSVASGPDLVHAWVVRWDDLGQNLAIWVADPGSDRIGRLNLFSVDRTAQLVDTNEPRLAADEVMSSLTFDDGHLVYTSAADGKTYMQAVPSVPPSTASTPSPTLPGQLPAVAGASSSLLPQPSDRPGS
ncbi:MAG: hypothetical protein ACHQ01_09745 [Candidatus Limnocylindrales bacterium]